MRGELTEIVPPKPSKAAVVHSWLSAMFDDKIGVQ